MVHLGQKLTVVGEKVLKKLTMTRIIIKCSYRVVIVQNSVAQMAPWILKTNK